MNANELQKLLQEQTNELQRHQKMLLEAFESRLQIIAEVQTDHTKKLDALMEMVALDTEQIDLIKGMLKRRVDIDEYEKLEKRVGLLEKKLYLSGSN